MSVQSEDLQTEATPTEPHLREAKPLPLANEPTSEAAARFIDSLLARVEDHDASSYRRGETRRKALRDAVGALAGGLLLHAERYGTEEWSWTKTTAQAFSGTPIGYRPFRLARWAFVREELVEERSSYTQFVQFGEGADGRLRFATRFRGTAALWAVAEQHGIRVSDATAHFRRIRPSDSSDPVQLKALSVTVRGKKMPGERLPLPHKGEHARHLQKIVAEIEEVNAYVASRRVEGCDPIRFYRGFTVDLSHGGRWYPHGGSYQGMTKEDRLALRIDGEPVTEVDVRASHLTLILGKFGYMREVTEDLYGGFGFHRDIVKAWIVATIGAGSPARRWSAQAAANVKKAGLSLQGIKAASVGDAVLARYPMLEWLPRVLSCVQEPRLCSLRLMKIEADALTAAMRRLRTELDTLALPMHDSLIVPRTAADAAGEALRCAYREAAGILPAIEIRPPA